MKKTMIAAAVALAVLAFSAASCNDVIKRTESVATQGQLCFQVEPPTAKVAVNGVEVGAAKDFTEAKGCLALEQGRHQIRITADGYLPYEREFYIGTSIQQVNLKLAKNPASGVK